MQTKNLAISLDNRKIAIIALSIQIAFLGVLGLNWVGLEIPILRETLGFLFLTFVPGILILQLLSLDFSKLNTWLYGIGISIAFVIFVGFFSSLVYPFLGIHSPLSLEFLTITIATITTLFFCLIYKRRKRIFPSLSFNIEIYPLSTSLFLILLPVLTALGTLFVHYYSNNILLIILLITIALIPIFAVFNRIPEKFFPLAVFTIFVSLLWHNHLFAFPYLSGRDIQIEYYYSNMVSLNSRWFPSFPENRNNSLLGDVILSTIYAKISGISLAWIVKLLYPFLFSIGLLALYQAFKTQMDKKLAFLSCFFFASLGINYESLSATMKHPMTVFFISLLVLLMVDRSINITAKKILSLPFAIGLVVSHYGVPYIFLFSSIFVLACTFLAEKSKLSMHNPLTTTNFCALFAVLTVSWFLYTSGSAGFQVVVRLGKNIVRSISELFAPIERGGVYYLISQLPSWEWEVLRILHIITQLFMVIGIFSVVYQKLAREESRINNEFLFYSLAFLGWLAASVVIPAVIGGHSLGMPRMYGLSVIFLAPFCIIGGIEVMKIHRLFKFKNSFSYHKISKHSLTVLAIFLLIFLTFNTRLVMEINQEMLGGERYVKSLSLSQPRIMRGESYPKETAMFFRDYNSYLDGQGAKWLKEYREAGKKVVIDYSSLVLVYAMIPLSDVVDGTSLAIFIKNIQRGDSYVYLRESNIKFNLMSGKRGKYWYTSEILPILETERNKIYSNGGSIIYE